MRRAHRPQFEMAGEKGRWIDRFFLKNHHLHAAASHTAKFILALLIWPRFIAPFRWQLTRRPLPLGGIDKDFAGYKILQLTDLHAGRVNPSYLEQVFRRCLEEKPDIIVITGDLIDYYRGNVETLAPLLNILVNAHVPDGIVAIFGNHDYFEHSWRHTGKRSAHRAIHRRLVRLLQSQNIRLLRNEQHRVKRGDAELLFVGLDELWTDLADPEKAFEGVRLTDPVICLQHNPDGIDMLRDYPWQYMLCGHTHGGQVVFPFAGAMYVPMQHREYLNGLFEFPPLRGQPVAKRQMFVSRGLGYSYPIRLRCRPEATLFTVTHV